MARIVMKFGGTSMAGTERIRRVRSVLIFDGTIFSNQDMPNPVGQPDNRRERA